MKLVCLLAVGALVVAGASGCSTAAPEPTTSTPIASATATGPFSAYTPTGTRTLTGTFVSQATQTSGEAVLTETPKRITLTLNDFSTGTGDELYVDLNLGAMTKNPAGDYVVEDPKQIQLAQLKSLTGTQSYDLTPQLGSLPEIKSITIYSYKTREAFGTANLHAK